jgi:hypothetical protein
MLKKKIQMMQRGVKLRGLMDYLKDFDFLFHLQLMLLILGHANALSLSLQRKDKDILESMTKVKLTKQKFQQIRDDSWDALLVKVHLGS